MRLFYFTGTIQEGALVVGAGQAPRYLVRRSLERAQRESPLPLITPYRSWRDLGRECADMGLGSASSATRSRSWPGGVPRPSRRA